MSPWRPRDRVRLVVMNDQYTHIPPGTLGTVIMVDDFGTVHVQWDNGSRLGVVADAGDRIERVKEDGDASPGPAD